MFLPACHRNRKDEDGYIRTNTGSTRFDGGANQRHSRGRTGLAVNRKVTVVKGRSLQSLRGGGGVAAGRRGAGLRRALRAKQVCQAIGDGVGVVRACSRAGTWMSGRRVR